MFTPKELFFTQRLLESLDYRAIDSYRVRHLNGLRSLEELLQVFRGCVKGRYKQYDYLDLCLNEAVNLIHNDEILQFPIFTKAFFIELLKKVNRTDFSKMYPTVKTAIKSILNANGDYLDT